MTPLPLLRRFQGIRGYLYYPAIIVCATIAAAPVRSATAQHVIDSTARSTALSTALSIDSGKSSLSTKPDQQSEKKAWYERLSLRGYTQIRYNGLFRTNPQLSCAQCDKTIGTNNGISVRRARLVLSGDINERVSVYIQPDFASEVSGNLHYAQLRDAYFDVALDKKKEFRVRIGQSKIPFGWENLQSSSNRLALDRVDALNSAIPNERDLGAIVYWAPEHIRKRFSAITDKGLKGTGDYGVVGLGVYNGQGANKADENSHLHTALRITYPLQLGNGQYVEVGIQGYTGQYVLPSSLRSSGLIGPDAFDDSRIAASFIWYPQPFGLQAEWNTGRGPEVDPVTGTTQTRSLDGGYVQSMYRIAVHGQVITPFVRAQRYNGGKKFEQDARRYRMRELEIGVEWLPLTAFELTAMYTISNRRYEDFTTPVNHQKGQFLRLQAQFNY